MQKNISFWATILQRPENTNRIDRCLRDKNFLKETDKVMQIL